MGELAALAASLNFAIATVIDKSMTVRFSPLSQNAIRVTGAALFNIIIFLALGKTDEIASLSLVAVGLMAAAGISNIVLADSVFLRVIRTVDITTAFPLAVALVTLFSVGVGALIFSEDVTWLTLLGAILVITGVYLLSFAPKASVDPRKTKALGPGGLAVIVAIALMWAAGVALMRVALDDLDVFTGAAIRTSAVLPVLFLTLGLYKAVLRKGRGARASVLGPEASTSGLSDAQDTPVHNMTGQRFGFGAGPSHRQGLTGGRSRRVAVRRSPSRMSHVLPILVTGLSGAMHFGLGSMLFFFALQKSGAAVTQILINTTILFIAPLSLIFLRERFGPRTIIGILVATVGILLVVV